MKHNFGVYESRVGVFNLDRSLHVNDAEHVFETETQNQNNLSNPIFDKFPWNAIFETFDEDEAFLLGIMLDSNDSIFQRILVLTKISDLHLLPFLGIFM